MREREVLPSRSCAMVALYRVAGRYWFRLFRRGVHQDDVICAGWLVGCAGASETRLGSNVMAGMGGPQGTWPSSTLRASRRRREGARPRKSSTMRQSGSWTSPPGYRPASLSPTRRHSHTPPAIVEHVKNGTV